MSLEAVIQDHAERIEYLKERARLAAVAMIGEPDLEAVAAAPGLYARDVLGALLEAAGPLMDAAAEASEDFARAGGLQPVPGGDEVVRRQVESEVFLWALPALESSLTPLVDNVAAQLASGVAESVVRASLEATEMVQVLMGSFVATVKRAAAELVQSVARWVMLEAARTMDTVARLAGAAIPQFVWITLQDSAVCKGPKEAACFPRHGVKGEFPWWENQGLPGAPNLRCRRGCRCVLVRDRPGVNPERPVNVAASIATAKERARLDARNL